MTSCRCSTLVGRRRATASGATSWSASSARGTDPWEKTSPRAFLGDVRGAFACRSHARRRNMERSTEAIMQGSVIKYDGKRGVSWTFVIDVGRDARGKRIQKWRRG